MRVVQQKQIESTYLTLRERPDEDVVNVFGIKSSLLIPGRGEPIKNGTVIIEGDKIAWVGHDYSLPAKYNSVSFTKVRVLLPGLWE